MGEGNRTLFTLKTPMNDHFRHCKSHCISLNFYELYIVLVTICVDHKIIMNYYSKISPKFFVKFLKLLNKMDLISGYLSKLENIKSI